MNSETQKQYFEIAYRTGSDVWSHLPYHTIAINMMPNMPADSMVLDIGAGRGIWISKLVAEGYRAIGLEYINDVVRKGNQDIKLHGFTDRARFIYGDVRDIPLTDDSFDAVTDIGVLQHLEVIDWHQYMSEVKRVLKPGGYLLNVSLSKETPRFMGFKPKTSQENQFEKFGVLYYFFSGEELNQLFHHHGFELVEQKTHTFESKTDPLDSLVLLFSIYQLKHE